MALSSSLLRKLAQAAGFDLCGFARATPIPAQTLLGWLEAGFAADMDWMGGRTAARLDVSVLLPGARTVVSLACNYYRDDEGTDHSPLARYARGRDYHYTLRDRLRAFRRELDRLHPEVGTYGSIDSGPVMEKVWAARAGLGYVGKNGCLITERYGSYVVLAALILDAEVEPEAYPEALPVDRCASCRACVLACPTDAIQLDRRVDSGRCLSYQTIENADEVPAPLRGAMTNVVFGCDICQDVCPHNRAPLPAGDRFAPRAVARLDTQALAALSPEEYQTFVPGTPLGRAQYDGLRRNAAYALGAAKAEEARPVLERLTADASEQVREAACWALGQLG